MENNFYYQFYNKRQVGKMYDVNWMECEINLNTLQYDIEYLVKYTQEHKEELIQFIKYVIETNSYFENFRRLPNELCDYFNREYDTISVVVGCKNISFCEYVLYDKHNPEYQGVISESGLHMLWVDYPIIDEDEHYDKGFVGMEDGESSKYDSEGNVIGSYWIQKGEEEYQYIKYDGSDNEISFYVQY